MNATAFISERIIILDQREPDVCCHSQAVRRHKLHLPEKDEKRDLALHCLQQGYRYSGCAAR